MNENIQPAGWQNLGEDLLKAILDFLSPRSQAQTFSVNKATNAAHQALQLQEKDWCRGVEPRSCDPGEGGFGWSSQEEMKTEVERLCACKYKSVKMRGSLPKSEIIPKLTLGRVFRCVTSITAKKQNLRFLCQAISSGALESVEVITLQDNIGDEGIVEFCNAVASVSLGSLKTLFLGYNKISGVGMAGLTRAISSGSLRALKELYLYGNHIGDAEMAEFSRAISSGSLPALQHVYLSGNPGSGAPVMEALAARIR